jgi:hypothetical protein
MRNAAPVQNKNIASPLADIAVRHCSVHGYGGHVGRAGWRMAMRFVGGGGIAPSAGHQTQSAGSG